MFAVITIDAVLLYRFFSHGRTAVVAVSGSPAR
jgi:hypothetical protein